VALDGFAYELLRDPPRTRGGVPSVVDDTDAVIASTPHMRGSATESANFATRSSDQLHSTVVAVSVPVSAKLTWIS
jgi:hypothetical protein